MSGLKHVIVGNSAAGLNAAKAIREIDQTSHIIMLTKEDRLAYSPVVLPYLLSGRVLEEQMYLTDKHFYEKYSIILKSKSHVVGIDTRQQKVYGKDDCSIEYDRLLIATGASPRRMPTATDCNDRVFTLRTMRDAKNIRKAAHNASDTLMIGAGLVGLETAYALKRAGKSVRIMAKSNHLLSRNSDEACAKIIQSEIEKEGVKFFFGVDVTSIEKENNKVCVKTDAGDKITTDLVVVGKGVDPNVQLANGTDIQVESGIRVNFGMQTSVANIYAAGDVAQSRNLLTGNYELFGNWPSACLEGKIAGQNMAGKEIRLAGEIAYNILPVFNCTAAFAEKRESEDEKTKAVTYVDKVRKIYRKLLIKNDRIVGAVLLGRTSDAGVVLDLMRKRRSVTPLMESLAQGPVSWGGLLKKR